MILGFTGTRQRMTPAQRAALPSVIAVLPQRVLHGGAIGADTEFHDFIMTQPLPCGVAIEIYPADEERQRFWVAQSHDVFYSGRDFLVHPVYDPLKRDGIIAYRCNALLAAPISMNEERRSGTWSTIRRARKFGRPITLLLPDGTIQQEQARQR